MVKNSQKAHKHIYKLFFLREIVKKYKRYIYIHSKLAKSLLFNSIACKKNNK